MQENNITLYAFPTGPGFFNFSPYCTKVEILLAQAGLEFSLEMPEDYKTFSKGRLPVLNDNGSIIEDSEIIRLHIAEKYGKELDGSLTAAEKATGHAVCRMLDERTIYGLVWTRWAEDAGWSQTKPIFFEGMPDATAEEMRAQVIEAIKAVGFGKFTSEEQKTFIRADLKTLSGLLGEREFFLSDEPTYLDATIFGHISNLYGTPIRSWTNELVGEHQNLVNYFNQGMARWYPNAVQAAAE